MKNEMKKIEKIKKIYSEKKSTKLHGPEVPNLINFFYSKRKKNIKLPGPMRAKSDTELPCFAYRRVRIFLDRL